MISFKFFIRILVTVCLYQAVAARPVDDLSGHFRVEIPAGWTKYEPADAADAAGSITFVKPDQKGWISVVSWARKQGEPVQNLDDLIKRAAAGANLAEGKIKVSSILLDGLASRLLQGITKDGNLVAILVSQKQLTSAIVIYRCQEPKDYQKVVNASLDGFHWLK